MAPVTLSVSWDDFPNVATSLFNDLSTDTAFTDVTLVSEDLQQVRAHRVILAASSTLLGSVLATLTRPDPLLYLKGVQHQQLEALLAFIYQGKVEVEEDMLDVFMEAATELGVKGLVGGGGGGKEAKAEKTKKKKVTKSKEQEENADQDSKDFNLVNLRIGEVEKVLRNETQHKDTDKDVNKDTDKHKDKDTDKEVNKDKDKHKDTDKELNPKKVKKIKKKPELVNEKSQHDMIIEQQSSFLEDSKEALRNALESVAKKTYEDLNRSNISDQIRSVPRSDPSEENLVDLVAFEEAQKDNFGYYSCNQCEYKSKNPSGLKRHFISHEKVKFTCMWDGCDQKYTRTDNMKKHMKTCHGIQGDDFGCDKCAMKFSFPEALKAHIVESHSKKRTKGQK